MNKEILIVKGVTKKYGEAIVLDHVDFDVQKGEIHALVGENGAGKSTLMNIVSGIVNRDEGEIFFNGRYVKFASARESVKSGIGFIHQEIELCQQLSVAENIYMWNIPRKGFQINSKLMYKNAKHILMPFNVDFVPTDRVDSLSIAQQQIVEIARAISTDAKLLIFDEPTSSLTEDEAQDLFRIIKDLKEKGIGIIYISHRMSEIFKLSDRITVLRDGKFIKTVETKKTTASEIVTSMVGRTIDSFYSAKIDKPATEEILKVENLSSPQFKKISFVLHRNEILGFSGLIGAGRSEVAKAICGIDHFDSGSIYFMGKEIHSHNYYESISQGICYLSEDRRKDGLFLQMPVRQNISAAVLDRISSMGVVDSAREKNISEQQIKTMNIKVSHDYYKAITLSGGNQQKVMIGKWLAANPSILFLDEPTRGIDIGAKTEIHHMIRNLCDKKNIGIILISSEMPEIIGMCDRVIVMHEGLIAGILSGNEITERNLILLASKETINNKEDY